MAPTPGPVVFDTAVLISAERGASAFRSLRAGLAADRQVAVVPAPVLAEVWRDGVHQALLAQALKATEPWSCDDELAKRAGELLAKTETTNTVDAIVVATAEHLLAPAITGDVGDLEALAIYTSPKVRVIPFGQ